MTLWRLFACCLCCLLGNTAPDLQREPGRGTVRLGCERVGPARREEELTIIGIPCKARLHPGAGFEPPPCAGAVASRVVSITGDHRLKVDHSPRPRASRRPPAPPRHADGRPEFSVSVMWALADFTAANGATRVVPGSHDDARAPSDAYEVE